MAWSALAASAALSRARAPALHAPSRRPAAPGRGISGARHRVRDARRSARTRCALDVRDVGARRCGAGLGRCAATATRAARLRFAAAGGGGHRVRTRIQRLDPPPRRRLAARPAPSARGPRGGDRHGPAHDRPGVRLASPGRRRAAAARRTTWTCRRRGAAWSIVCGAPRSRSSGGRSAVSTTSGTRAIDASTTAGSRLATAVPDVTTMATARRDARARPSAKNPAARSSSMTRTVRPGCARSGEGQRRRARPGAHDDLGDPGRHELLDDAAKREHVGHRSSPVDAAERRRHRPQLEPRLLPLPARIGVRDDPAAGEQRRVATASTRPQRSATISSPSPSAPSQPIGPAYQPRSNAFVLGDEVEGDLARRAADGRRRMELAAERQQPGLVAQRPGDRRHEVLDVPERQDRRALGDVRATRRSARGRRGASRPRPRAPRGPSRSRAGPRPSRASSSASAPRAADPAIATVSNERPTVRTSRSGVAPRNVVPSRVNANVVLSGALDARWRRAAATSRSVAARTRPGGPARPCRSGHARPPRRTGRRAA